jgi:uncharacterized protein
MTASPIAQGRKLAARAAGGPRIAIACLAVLVASCSVNGPEHDDGPHSDLLAAVGECALGRFAEFERLARDLTEATAALAAEPSADKLAAAQASYRAAMSSWQRAELFHIGPSARRPAPGGQNLRDDIYFFPGGNNCLVDQQIVSEMYSRPTFATRSANARGLGALEYLLFHDGPDNACGASVSINGSGSWTALSMQELSKRRAEYANATASVVLERAAALRGAWDPAEGDFLGQLAAPGPGRVYADERAALEAVIAAAFYVDQELKDLKLGAPLGLHEACPNRPNACPDAIESRHARLSGEHIRQNLTGLRMIFEGCGPNHAGLGIDDWLRTKDGGEELAERMLAALDVAEVAIANLDPQMEEAIFEVPPERVMDVHQAIKGITDVFKTEVINLLMVSLPASGGGDND